VANTWTRAALAGSKIPVIATEHSRDTWKPGYYRKVDKLLSRVTAGLVAVSGDTADFYENTIGVGGSFQGNALRAQWVSNDNKGVSAQGGETVLLGTVGRMITAKNHPRLVDAFKRLVHDPELQDTSLKLVFVGDGPEREKIESYVAQNNLGAHVIFTGTRHDIPDVLAAFDVFVLSSDREGHPLTALEAQAAGTTVVLTDAGGSADAIASADGQTGGVLVERSDEALALALRELVLDVNLRDKRARFGQSHALANFDKRHMVQRYVDLFERVSR